MSKFFRKVYNTLTGHSKSGAGKFFKYAYPFNAGYLGRRGWHSLKKRILPKEHSAVSIGSVGSDIYGPTGSIVGRY